MSDLGGFAAVARAINDRCAPEHPVSRQLVHKWNESRTLNRDGAAFPSPVREVPGVLGLRKPRLLFRVADVLAWYAAGVPDLYGAGWRGGE